jgi:hypothetical protein
MHGINFSARTLSSPSISESSIVMVMAIWWHTPMEPRSLMGEISDMYIGTTTVLIPM